MCETRRKRGSEAEEQNEQARFVFLVWLQDRKQTQEEVTMKNTMECVYWAHSRHGFGSGTARAL